MSVTWQDEGLADDWQASTPVDSSVDRVLGDDGVTVYLPTGAGTTGGTRPSPFSGSVVLDPDVFADFHWVPLGPWTDIGNGQDITAGAQVQPSVPNGHFYSVVADGVTGGTEPDWPTDGGTVEDDAPLVGDTDPGDIALDVYIITPPGDTIEYAATLRTAKAKSIRPERNGIGSGQFSIWRYSPEATADVLRQGNLVKVRVDYIDDPIFSFFLEEGDFTLVSRDESGGEMLSFKGGGGLSYLDLVRWLSRSFVIDWWISGTPDADDIGQLEVAAGKHVRYTIVGGVIDHTSQFSVGAFTAFYGKRKTFNFAGSHPGLHRQLVQLSSGPHAGLWLHTFDDGMTDHRAKTAFDNKVFLTTIGDSPGQVLYRMILEGQAANRPVQPIPLLSVDFTDTEDSNGNPWTTTDALTGLAADLGESFLTTLGKLLGTGVIDVEMSPDLVLHAWNAPSGRDLSGAFDVATVRFEKGVSIADSLDRNLDPGPVATWAEVLGTDDAVGYAELTDAASRITREATLRGETSDSDALAAQGLAELERQLIRSDEARFLTRVGDDPANGKYRPGPPGTAGHYWTRDIVSLHTGTTDQDFDEATPTVDALVLEESESGDLRVTGEVGQKTLAQPGGSLPQEIEAGGCNCPCDLGDQVPDSDPPIYLGAYNRILVGTGTGSTALYTLPNDAAFVEGSLTVLAMPSGGGDGAIKPTTVEDPLSGTFTVSAASGASVYALCRVACQLVIAC